LNRATVTRPHARIGEPLQAQRGTSVEQNRDLRDSGIRLLGNMPWGSHICVLYETPHDLLESVASYFKVGLDDNEFCVWAISGPITIDQARESLRSVIPKFDKRYSSGQIELIPGRDWYLRGDDFDLERITSGWNRKLSTALERGYDGLRISGNAFWVATNHWNEFSQYEAELDRAVVGQKMLVLCTYQLSAVRARDILDIARAHKCTLARRNGDWEFLETPELVQARHEISRLNGALDVLSKPFPRFEHLTPKERSVLAQIVRGASSKEAGRTLGVSHRTIEFHRANILKKLGVKNGAELLQKTLGK
jgi:DNA-binding CsgD family transcriptional regulator